MRILALSLMLFTVAACARPSTQYTVAPPEVVETEAQHQEEMIQAGSRTLTERGPVSFSNRMPTIQRLTAVAERVLISAAPYCGNNVIPGYALSVGTPDYGYPVVINAASAHQPGDRIIEVDGQRVPTGPSAFEILGRYGGAQAQQGATLQVTALRGQSGQRIQASYSPVNVCRVGVVLEDNDMWNAYADGKSIHVEQDLMEDITNDDELAFVIAHELSHNLLGHVEKSQSNVLVGAATGLALESVFSAISGADLGGNVARVGAAAGRMSYSKEFEREADYVGLYILATTGYDLKAGPRVARAIARQDARSIRYASTHPSSAERAASLNATIAEIQTKIRQGQPLYPNKPKKE